MKTTLKVEGMMCHHCENHVQKAVLKLDGALSCTANHQSGTVEIEYSDTFSIEKAKAVITEEGYAVIE